MSGCKKLLFLLLAGFLLILLAAAPAGSPLRRELALPEKRGAAERAAAGPGGRQAAVWVGGLDLNAASAAELETLPGIGGALAGRIVRWREENGPFRQPEDLLRVKGIGEKTLDKLCRYKETP